MSRCLWLIGKSQRSSHLHLPIHSLNLHLYHLNIQPLRFSSSQSSASSASSASTSVSFQKKTDRAFINESDQIEKQLFEASSNPQEAARKILESEDFKIPAEDSPLDPYIEHNPLFKPFLSLPPSKVVPPFVSSKYVEKWKELELSSSTIEKIQQRRANKYFFLFRRRYESLILPKLKETLKEIQEKRRTALGSMKNSLLSVKLAKSSRLYENRLRQAIKVAEYEVNFPHPPQISLGDASNENFINLLIAGQGIYDTPLHVLTKFERKITSLTDFFFHDPTGPETIFDPFSPSLYHDLPLDQHFSNVSDLSQTPPSEDFRKINSRNLIRGVSQLLERRAINDEEAEADIEIDNADSNFSKSAFDKQKEDGVSADEDQEEELSDDFENDYNSRNSFDEEDGMEDDKEIVYDSDAELDPERGPFFKSAAADEEEMGEELSSTFDVLKETSEFVFANDRRVLADMGLSLLPPIECLIPDKKEVLEEVMKENLKGKRRQTRPELLKDWQAVNQEEGIEDLFSQVEKHFEKQRKTQLPPEELHYKSFFGLGEVKNGKVFRKIRKINADVEIIRHSYFEPEALSKKQRNFLERKVKIKIRLLALHLSQPVLDRIGLVCGKRYNPVSKVLTVTTDHYNTKFQNTLHAFRLIRGIITDALQMDPCFVPFSDLELGDNYESILQDEEIHLNDATPREFVNWYTTYSERGIPRSPHFFEANQGLGLFDLPSEYYANKRQEYLNTKYDLTANKDKSVLFRFPWSSTLNSSSKL